jgi:hypothetical protein
MDKVQKPLLQVEKLLLRFGLSVVPQSLLSTFTSRNFPYQVGTVSDEQSERFHGKKVQYYVTTLSRMVRSSHGG